MDSTALPKGHIIGWTPPPAAPKPGAGITSASGAPLSKNAKKRQKQKEKKVEAVKDNWDDEDGEEEKHTPGPIKKSASVASNDAASGTHTPDNPNWAAATDADGLADKLEKLEVQ